MTLPGNVPRENRRGLIQGDGSLGPTCLQVHPGFIQDPVSLPWLQIAPPSALGARHLGLGAYHAYSRAPAPMEVMGWPCCYQPFHRPQGFLAHAFGKRL